MVTVRGCFKILCYAFCSAPVRFTLQLSVMAIRYNKLWKLLIDKGMTKTELRIKAGLTTNALARLGKNESVQVETLFKICDVLGCNLDDIAESVPTD